MNILRYIDENRPAYANSSTIYFPLTREASNLFSDCIFFRNTPFYAAINIFTLDANTFPCYIKIVQFGKRIIVTYNPERYGIANDGLKVKDKTFLSNTYQRMHKMGQTRKVDTIPASSEDIGENSLKYVDSIRTNWQRLRVGQNSAMFPFMTYSPNVILDVGLLGQNDDLFTKTTKVHFYKGRETTTNTGLLCDDHITFGNVKISKSHLFQAVDYADKELAFYKNKVSMRVGNIRFFMLTKDFELERETDGKRC